MNTLRSVFAESYFQIVLILTTVLTISGLSITESLRCALVIGIICAFGGYFWQSISKKKNMSTYEFIGMGLAFGSIFSSFSQIIFRNTPLNPYSWAIPVVSIALFAQMRRQFSNRINKSENVSSSRLIATYLQLTAVVSLALAYLWWWIYPFAISIAALYALHEYRNRKGKQTNFLLLAIGLAIFIMSYLWSTNIRGLNDSWKVISHDQVFSESLSWSLNIFGPTDSPFFSGKPINYHWLAIHWGGLISEASNSQSWISITRVLPVLSYLGIFCLLVAISSFFYMSKTSETVIAIVFLFMSNNFGFNLERFISSPSFQFSCIWMLATLNILLSWMEHPTKIKILLSALLHFATLGGKVMNGIIIFGGVLALFTFACFRKNLNKWKLLIMLMTLSLASLAAYIYFFQSTSISNTNSLRWSLEIGRDVGIIYPESTLLLKIIAALIFNLSVSLPMLSLALYFLLKRAEFGSKAMLIAFTLIVGVLLTSTTTHEGASQLYFNMSSMVASFAAMPLLFANFKLNRVQIAILIAISLTLGSFSIWAWDISSSVSSYQLSIFTKIISVSITPLILFAFWLATRLQVSIFFFPRGRIFLFSCLIVLVSSSFIGVFQRVDRLPSAAKAVATAPTNPTLITGSTDHQIVLEWIKENTPSTDIVAINRFCIPGIESCIMKWQIVSALSHRRILFEGGYGSPTSLQPGETQDRYKFSTEFAQSPSLKSLRYLCDKGVDWFFYDSYETPKNSSWSPYADIVIDRTSVTLLKLNCNYSVKLRN